MVVQYVWMHHFVEKHNPSGDVAKSKGNNARAAPGSDQFALRNEMCHLSKCWGLVLLPWIRADLHVSVHTRHWQFWQVPAVAVVLFSECGEQFFAAQNVNIAGLLFLSQQQFFCSFPAFFFNTSRVISCFSWTIFMQAQIITKQCLS